MSRQCERSLLDRLGLDEALVPSSEVESRLGRTERRVLDVFFGGVGHEVGLSLPQGLSEVIRAAVALERQEGRVEAAEALLAHHLDHIPTVLLLQWNTDTAVGRRLFHEPVEPRAWRWLGTGLAGWSALLARSGVEAGSAQPVLASMLAGEVVWSAQYARTFFGRSQPMLVVYPPQLEALEGQGHEAAAWAPVFDGHLAGAWLHELGHFGPERAALFPYLDEAVAGYLGMAAWPGAVFPAAGQPGGLWGWPAFTQVGQAMARLFGLEAVVRAQAGVMPWEEVLGAGLLRAMERLWWEAYQARREVSFHPDTRRPDRWVRLMELAASGVEVEAVTAAELDGPPPKEVEGVEGDRALVRETLLHAVSSACLVKRPGLCASSLAAMEVPSRPIRIEFAEARCELEGGSPAGLHVVPWAWASRLRRAGVRALEVRLSSVVPEALEAAAAALEGSEGGRVSAPGFEVSAVR